MSKSKVELVQKAYEILRISGLTTRAVPEEISIGIDELEGMMNEFEARNVCSSYVFEDDPQENTDANVELAYQKAVEYNLAARLATYFGKEPTAGMVKTAIASLSTWTAASGRVNQMKYPNRQAKGSGNTFRFSNRERYYRQASNAPISCETNYLKVDEINNFSYDFNQYLEGSETISSFTTDVSNGLDLLSSAIQGTKIVMSVKGVKTGLQSILVTITTSTGRVNPQTINFQVSE